MNRRIEKIFAVTIPSAILLLFAGVLYAATVPTPVLSVDSGFYGEEFMVTIQMPPGCTAYYTIDGTEPNEYSDRYSSGILIYDRTPENARFATIEDVSGQLLWSGGGNIYSPSYSIPKATVLTVKLQDKNGRWSDTIQNFYYVGEDYQKYQNITVVSLAVCPEDLFGEDGIYVNGEEYNSYVNTNNLSRIEGPELEHIWALANWGDKGENSRREALVTILKDGEVYQSNAKINIAGHTSRIYPQKSFNVRYDSVNDWLIFDKSYDTLGNAIQGLTSYKLRNGGTQNQNDFLNDYVCQALSSELAFDTQSQQLCVLFLNGEYWGIYELTERYNADYFYSHYGLREQNNPALIKSGYSEKEDIRTKYENLINWIRETDFSKQGVYKELSAKIDITSLVQLYATNIYLANLDFGTNNIACWCSLDSGNSQYAIWKWMMYDCDTTFNDIDIISMLEHYLKNDWLFAKLCQNNQFCYELAKSIREMQDTVFCTEKVEGPIDEMIIELLPFIEDHYNRIGPDRVAALDSSQKKDFFRNYGERIKAFFSNRCREDTSSIEYVLETNRYFPVETVWLSGDDWNADQYIVSGISSNQLKYTWTNDNEVVFKSLYFGDGTAEVKCQMKVVVEATQGEQRVSVIVNEQEVYSGNISGCTELSIPFLTDKNGRADIFFYLPDAITPLELGISPDERKLSLSLSAITFEQNSPSLPNKYGYVPVETIWFYGEEWNADQYISKGLGWNQGTYTWFEGNEVCFYSCNFGNGTSRTGCRMNLSISNTLGEQRVLVLVNEEIIYFESITGPTEVTIPFSTDENGSAQILIHLPDAISPKEIDNSDDSRMLSLSMTSILIEEKQLKAFD